MEGDSASYAAGLWCIPRPSHLVALYAIWLLLVPQTLAQSVDITYGGGVWSTRTDGGTQVHYSSSRNARATFVVDTDQYHTINISAGVMVPSNKFQPASLNLGSMFLDNINNNLVYPIPFPTIGIQEYNIAKKDSSPSSSTLYVISVILGGKAGTSNTQILSPTTAAATPQGVSSISANSLLDTASSLNRGTSSSALSVTSATSSGSETSLPLGSITAIPTGLDSPPPNTNIASSISNTSFASDSSNSSGPSSSAIVGAVFGILIGITLCVFAALFYRRRRKRNRVAPSTAFMNYRSTTEQPPAYPFSRTSFFRRSMSGLGAGDTKMSSPHRYAPGAYGATATGAGGRRLMTLDEKSAEGGDSQRASAIVPSYEDPQRPVVPAPPNGAGGVVAPSVVAGVIYAPGLALRGFSIDGGVARTLTPPPSTTSSKFASTPSLMDQNPYDGIAEPVPDLPNNPFKTPLAGDNVAGRGAWGRA